MLAPTKKKRKRKRTAEYTNDMEVSKLAKGPEVRMSQGTIIAIIAIVGLLVWAPWKDTATTPTGNVVEGQQPPLTVVPAIEKTKLYFSTYDAADFEGEKQLNRVAGSADLIKSGNVLEAVTTTTTSGAASASELNGGDVFSAIGDATNYYAGMVKNSKVTETNQPVQIMMRAAATPTVTLLDENKNTVSAPYEFNLSTNDVSKTYYVRVERPGDDTWYQMCLVASDYDDDEVQVQVKDKTGSFNKGSLEIQDVYDELHNSGMDAVWKYEQDVQNYDQYDIPFIVKTAKDVDPSATTALLQIVDCEYNLQAGDIVLSNEDASDADVGLANINVSISIV